MFEQSRLHLTPRSPRTPVTFEEEEEEDDFLEILKRLGVPTYYSKSQFAIADHSVFDEKLHELIDGKDHLNRRQKQRKRWLKLFRNYSRLVGLKPLLRHFYEEQVPRRYNLFVMRQAFKRWRIRKQWYGLSAIINRLYLRRAANDDKERISQRRVLISSKYLLEQPDIANPNYHYFILNAIPNPTTCTSKINEEDDAADREEYRLANLEYLHWMEEEEEAAERARRKKRMRRVSPKKQIEPPSDSLENSEINEVPNEDEIPQTPPFGNVEETTKVDTSLQDSEIKERDVNINSSDSGSEKGKKRKYRKEVAEQKVPEHSKKHTFILIACIAFVLGFVLPLFYYIHTGEIHDAKSFFYVVRTTLFGLNYTEKCMLDPECRRKTEQMLLDAEESKRLAEETKRKAQEDLERQQKEYLEKEALLKEKRKLKKEERRRIEEERRAEEERQIKKLKMLALSKDPETRDQWIKTELKKLSGDLKSIVDEQDEMSERLSHMKTEFDLEDEPESENEE